MNKNARLFLLCAAVDGRHAHRRFLHSIVDTIFIGWSAGELGFASVAVTWPLVMMFGAVGDMLGTGAAIIIAQSERQRATCGWHGSARQHAGLAGIVQLADDDCRQMFSDRYTPSVRRYRRTDARRRALFADFDIRQSGLYAGNRRAGGNP